MAVPFLTSFMYEEWNLKMAKLRQANRMVSKHRSRGLRRSSMDEQTKFGALGLCKAHGIFAFVYACMHACMHLCRHTNIHKHTHTHTKVALTHSCCVYPYIHSLICLVLCNHGKTFSRHHR